MVGEEGFLFEDPPIILGLIKTDRRMEKYWHHLAQTLQIYHELKKVSQQVLNKTR